MVNPFYGTHDLVMYIVNTYCAIFIYRALSKCNQSPIVLIHVSHVD